MIWLLKTFVCPSEHSIDFEPLVAVSECQWNGGNHARMSLTQDWGVWAQKAHCICGVFIVVV